MFEVLLRGIACLGCAQDRDTRPRWLPQSRTCGSGALLAHGLPTPVPQGRPTGGIHHARGAQNAAAPLALPVPSPHFLFPGHVMMRGDLLVVGASGFSTLPLLLKSWVLNFTCLRAEMSFFTCVDEA